MMAQTYADQMRATEEKLDATLDRLAQELGVSRSSVDRVFHALMVLLQQLARACSAICRYYRTIVDAQELPIH